MALQKRVILLTGIPHVGKTTVILKTVTALKERGIFVGGVISREAREGGTRVGFEILDLNSGKQGWLAHVNLKAGPQVGRYRVNLEDLEGVGAQAISDAVENCAVVAIDEIGPMELFSAKFKAAVQKALESSKPILAIIHRKADAKLIREAKSRKDAEIITVTQENRNVLPVAIAEKTVELLP